MIVVLLDEVIDWWKILSRWIGFLQTPFLIFL